MRLTKKTFMVAMVAAAVVFGGWVGDAVGNGQAGQQVPAARVAKAPLVDDTYRTVFFAVLEGLYDDGASNEFVDTVLRTDPETGAAMHFVGACPLCLPAQGALRVYRSRADLGLKGGDTFGDGVDAEVVAGMQSESMDDRLEAVETLVARYVGRRLTLMRLTPEELGDWRMRMASGRKKGEAMLREMQRSGVAGAFAGQKRCGVCDGANEAFDFLE